MNSTHFQGSEDGGIAEVSFDPAQIHGSGGAFCPRLHLQGELKLNRARRAHVDYVFTELNAWIWRDGIGKIADSLPVKLTRVQRGHQESYGGERVSLEFPLDARRVQLLEEVRAGGDMPLKLNLRLAAQQHAPIQGDEKVKRPHLWGLCWLYEMPAQMDLTVPRSAWVERVLRQVGYGTVHVVELPAVPLENWQGLKHSYDALKQAQERHFHGLYDDAVGKCRLALEPFFDHVAVDPTHKESRKVPVLKKAWELKLGKATYDWLNGALVAIKDAANRTHHSPNAHYSQLDSQMIQAVTTAVISYAARTAQFEESPNSNTNTKKKT
jgi:hypothetical protein